MRSLGNEVEKTPREMDMALFAMHKEAQNKDEYPNLY